MRSIVWLASFPRSGNTWARAVLTNLITRAQAPARINGLLIRSAASRLLFDDHVGIAASDLPREQVQALRPALYEQLASAAPPPLLLKIHDANEEIPGGARLVPRGATLAAIYLVRNPLDVAVSFAAYSGWTHAEAVDAMNRSSLTLCGSSRRTTLRLPQRLGSWSSHVLSWIDEKAFQVRVVRYEDLLSSPFEEFGAIARLAGLDPPADALRRAIRFSSFEELRSQEAASGFDECSPRAETFFRSGKKGSWRGVLTPQQAERVRRDHASVMQRLGYA